MCLIKQSVSISQWNFLDPTTTWKKMILLQDMHFESEANAPFVETVLSRVSKFLEMVDNCIFVQFSTFQKSLSKLKRLEITSRILLTNVSHLILRHPLLHNT